MNWFDYGFAPPLSPAAHAPLDLRSAGFLTPQQGGLGFSGISVPQTMPTFQNAYALQPSPVIAAYARPSFGSVAPFSPVMTPASGYAVPFGAFPVIQDVPGVQTGAWPALPEPSPLRAIGFQPSIPVAGPPQFQSVFPRIPNDDEIEDVIGDTLDAYPFLSANSEVEVRCESGQVTLTGTAQHKRVKHAIGEIAWSVPGVVDVKNNIELAHRRYRAGLRKDNQTGSVQSRK